MPHLPIAISLAKPVSPCVHDPPRPTLSSVSTSQSRLPCYQLILARVPLTLTPHTPAHQAQGGPSPGPLSLVCSPRQPGPHRSTGTSLGKTRPQGPGQGLKDRRRTPKVQRARSFPALGPASPVAHPKRPEKKDCEFFTLRSASTSSAIASACFPELSMTSRSCSAQAGHNRDTTHRPGTPSTQRSSARCIDVIRSLLHHVTRAGQLAGLSHGALPLPPRPLRSRHSAP